MQSITLGGQEFPIRFDINVVQKIQGKYGDVNLLDSKLRDFEEMKWVMSLLISEGLEYEAFALQRPARKVSPEQVGTLLTIKDFLSGSISQKVIDAFNESLGDEKNWTAEDLMMLANSMEDKSKTK